MVGLIKRLLGYRDNTEKATTKKKAVRKSSPSARPVKSLTVKKVKKAVKSTPKTAIK